MVPLWCRWRAQAVELPRLIRKPPGDRYAEQLAFKDTLSQIDPVETFIREHPRVMGGLQFVGGVAEVAAGVVTSEVGVGLVLAAHGVDNAQAGARTVWTGQYQSTGLNYGLRATGLSPRAAGSVDMLVGGGISTIGSVSALGAVGRSSRVATSVDVLTSRAPGIRLEGTGWAAGTTAPAVSGSSRRSPHSLPGRARGLRFSSMAT